MLSDGVLLGGEAGRAGEEDADAADELAVLVERDAAGQRARCRGGLGRRLRRRRRTPYDSGADRVLPGWDERRVDVEPLGNVNVVGRALDVDRGRGERAVAVGVLDGEQVDLRRVGDAGREVAADADRGDEARAADRRVRVGDVRVRLDLALGDRGSG